jgi:hypothetical protein
VLLEQHLLRCLCVCGVWDGLPGIQVGWAAAPKVGWGSRQSELPQLETDESSPRDRGNKRQKYINCCSSSRIEYLHPVTSACTWLDQAKAHQKRTRSPAAIALNLQGWCWSASTKHRKALCCMESAESTIWARGYEDATLLARLSRPCRHAPAATLIGPRGYW